MTVSIIRVIGEGTGDITRHMGSHDYISMYVKLLFKPIIIPSSSHDMQLFKSGHKGHHMNNTQ